MEEATVLVIEESAAEAALVAAALALRPELRVIDAPNAREAAERLQSPPSKVVLAIVGAAALAAPPVTLLGLLGARQIPVVGIAAGLSAADRQRALDAGVREVHERPQEWQPYSELIESLAGRFIRTG